jgi:hypothetical protein
MALTIEELLTLPEDGLRHELLDGLHVVTPAPEYPHQAVLGKFHLAIAKALEGNPGLELTWTPAPDAAPITLNLLHLFESVLGPLS